MPSVKQTSEAARDQAAWFATTHWSVVLVACQQNSAAPTEALERLCSTYWYPLFVYLRRSGYQTQDAQDLTQSFFVHLLDKDRLRTVSPLKGKFRSFLLVSLKNFLTNEFDKSQALKRGGNFPSSPSRPRAVKLVTGRSLPTTSRRTKLSKKAGH